MACLFTSTTPSANAANYSRSTVYHCKCTAGQGNTLRGRSTSHTCRQQDGWQVQTRALSAATPSSRSLPLWEQLLSTAANRPAACPEVLYGEYATHFGATVVAPQEAADVQAATTLGLVRSRVVKNKRGYWRIRHFQPTDLHAVADLQAAAFHESLPVGALDKLAYTMFKAEVLDALKKKVGVLSDHGFAMMVVETCQLGSAWCSSQDAELCPTDSDSDTDSSSECDWESAVWYGDQQAASWPAAGGGSSSSSDSLQDRDCMARPNSIMGVVEVGVQDEADVLQYLAGHSGTYAYITSMAVAPHLRRCGVGRALLQAAEQQAANWGQDVVALHVYDSNTAAIRLYEKHGMRCYGKDPAWKAMIGGKVRQLMVKPVRSAMLRSS